MKYGDFIPEEFNEDGFTLKVEELSDNKNNNMDNGIGKLSSVNVKSAVIYGLILGIVAVLIYMVKVGTVFALDWKVMLDAFIYGFIGSVLKNLFTTDTGNFLGMVKVIPPTK